MRCPPPFVVAALALGSLAACDEGKSNEAQAAEPRGSRFVAVAKQESQRTPEAFCDERPSGDEAPTFRAPPLAEGAELPGDGWRWINLWATWCKPCVEEMPLLSDWQRKLADDGVRFDLVFLSVDEDADTIAEFRADHPDIPETLRIQDLDALPPFLDAVGLDEATPIPVQIFVDGDQRIRCVRAGAVGDDDYSAVRAILQ